MDKNGASQAQVSPRELTRLQKVILRVPVEMVPPEYLRPVHQVGMRIDRYLPFMCCIYCGRVYPVFNGGNQRFSISNMRLHCVDCYNQVDNLYLDCCPVDATGRPKSTKAGRRAYHREAELNPIPPFPEELLGAQDPIQPPWVSLQWDDIFHIYRAQCIAPALRDE